MSHRAALVFVAVALALGACAADDDQPSESGEAAPTEVGECAERPPPDDDVVVDHGNFEAVDVFGSGGQWFRFDRYTYSFRNVSSQTVQVLPGDGIESREFPYPNRDIAHLDLAAAVPGGELWGVENSFRSFVVLVERDDVTVVVSCEAPASMGFAEVAADLGMTPREAFAELRARAPGSDVHRALQPGP